MTDRLVKASSERRGTIKDFQVVEADGGPLVLCALTDTVDVWDPVADRWTTSPLREPYLWNGEAYIASPDDGDHPDFDGEIEVGSLAAVVHDGRVLVAGGGEHTPLAVWDAVTGAVVRRTALRGDVWNTAAAWLDGRPIFLACPNSAPFLSIWPLEPQAPPVRLPRHHGDGITALAAGEYDGGPLAVSGCLAGIVGVWDLRRAELLTGFEVEKGSVRGVALSRVGDTPVVVAAEDKPGTLYVRELVSGGLLSKIETDHQRRIFALDAAVVGGRSIAVTGCEGGVVRLWDLGAGKPIGEPLTGHRGQVYHAAITTLDGRPVALTAGQDSRVRVWDLSDLPG
ncbi:hypothetical protein [Nonomuraea longicatena]|uniref:Uncharacterized protein n=1 Tax=Nonomuraea longicatena TaxID=83682 RepID=A0ABN1PJM6_9ACTN